MSVSRLWIVLLVAALGGCAGIPQGTLELKDVMALSVEQVEGDEPSLRIQGVSANSGAAISRIDVVTRGDDLIVLPRQVLAHQGLTGNFYLVLKVPPHVHRVLFGEEGREIWPHVPPPPIRPKSREESAGDKKEEERSVPGANVPAGAVRSCGDVPDAGAAARLAEVELVKKYGKDRVAKQLPLRVEDFSKHFWLVSGEVNPPIPGGNFGVVIDKRTGCVRMVEIMK